MVLLISLVHINFAYIMFDYVLGTNVKFLKQSKSSSIKGVLIFENLIFNLYMKYRLIFLYISVPELRLSFLIKR